MSNNAMSHYMSAKYHLHCSAGCGRFSGSFTATVHKLQAETNDVPNVPDVPFFRQSGSVGRVIHCRSAGGSGGSVCLRMLLFRSRLRA